MMQMTNGYNSTLVADMQQERNLARTIKQIEGITKQTEFSERMAYFRLENLKAQHRKIQIKLLVQVPDGFVQKLIDQTFLL